MKIVFLLPCSGEMPAGGLKIVYQYADGLAGRGHEITVVHPSFLSSVPVGFGFGLRSYLLNYMKQAVNGTWGPDRWFRFKYPVKLLWTPALHRYFIPHADAYVATSWLTAEKLASWPSISHTRLYLIQHLETWGGPEDRVLSTWRAGLTNIVIARWLEAIAHENGQKAIYIPNCVDFDSFNCDQPVEDREPTRVAMLYHDFAWKGSADGIQALKIAKGRVPNLTTEMFGVPDPPPDLPEWIRYRRNPPQQELRALYNRAAIFVAPSWTEGWGLPPSEAMMCGAAVAATDINGHREFCIDGETALMAPAQNPLRLADCIVRLVTNAGLRMQIAVRGHEYIKQFTWTKALDAFEKALGVSIYS
jgi:glycosyltransferase involved in cell wall biosynthesis